MASVNILFLSDLHFTKKDEEHAKDLEECAKWYIDAISMVDEAWKPQIVAIAGDIGFFGAAADYQFFSEAFLLPLLEKLNIPLDHVIMCPGNHDKDDSRFPKRAPEGISWWDTEELESPQFSKFKDSVYKSYRSDCNTQKFVLDTYAVAPFQNYINFLKEQGIPAFDITKFDYAAVEGAEYLYGYRNIDGIDFYCYNSAWDCLHNDKMDKGNLRIGPVRRRTDTKSANQFIISLVHHPQDWLSIEAVSSLIFRREVISNESDIAVHGHMHAANIYQDEDCKAVLVQLPTWSSPDTDFGLWQSYIFRIDTSDFLYSRMPIFWHRDNGHVYAATVEGRTEHHLRLPQKLELEKKNIYSILDDLYRMLLNNLERFMAHPGPELLQTILELIGIIAQSAVKMATNKQIQQIQVIDKMMQFNGRAISITKAATTENNLYDELIEDAGALHDSITSEISQILTRRISYV